MMSEIWEFDYEFPENKKLREEFRQAFARHIKTLKRLQEKEVFFIVFSGKYSECIVIGQEIEENGEVVSKYLPDVITRKPMDWASALTIGIADWFRPSRERSTDELVSIAIDIACKAYLSKTG